MTNRNVINLIPHELKNFLVNVRWMEGGGCRILHRILAGLHNRERLTGSYIRSYQGARLVGSYQGGKVGRILHRILSERKVGRILHYNFTEMNFL